VKTLRHEFEVRSPVKSARLYATALGDYEMFLNGNRVGDQVLAPGWTSYHHRLRYQTYDITSLLREGENKLEVLLGNGWFRGHLTGGGRRALYGDRLALLAQLEVTYADGSVDVIGTDERWSAAGSGILADDLYDGQRTDLRPRAPGADPVDVLEEDLGRLVAPDGELRTLARDRDGDRFRGAVVGLGALGVVATLTLDLVPAFEVQQYVYEGLPAAMLRSHFDEIFGSGYSVSVFTDWQGTRHSQVWVKQRVGGGSWPPEQRWMGATLADRQLHPIPGQPAEHATQQLGVPGPWHERLPHFRGEFTPSAGAELQSEYLLPRQRAAAAFDALTSLASVVAPVLQICEIRTVAPDDLWLSPSYQRDTVALHFTWIKDTAAVTPVIAAIEHLLAPLGARPHWAKLFTTAPNAVRALYPRSADFQRLLRDMDPAGKFRNTFVSKYFPAGN